MQLEILVEPAAGGGFIARSGGPFDLVAEGPSAEAAVGAVRELADGRVRGGARLVHVPLATEVVAPTPPGENPWLRLAGMWKDDPTLDDFRAEVERYREEREHDGGSPP